MGANGGTATSIANFWPLRGLADGQLKLVQIERGLCVRMMSKYPDEAGFKASPLVPGSDDDVDPLVFLL